MITDILIIGSGIAGLSFAIKAASAFPEKQVLLITKGDLMDSNTNLAQGGIAVALDVQEDSFEKHVDDTLNAGDGLCDKAVVEMVVREAPARFNELAEWGIDFDRTESGSIDLAREGGHTARRIVHHKDATGNHVAAGLLAFLKSFGNVKMQTHHFAVDLIIKRDRLTGKKTCTGVYVLDVARTKLEIINSKLTFLATGGSGQIYETTTNPLVATGDGIAMAKRAGALIRDMEFVQFHPTAFYNVDENPSFLISEAVRGFGGYLRGKDGDRFVFRYDNRGELASRDIVAKAIQYELINGGQASVFLDCTHLPPEEVKEHFPNIYSHCLDKGFDLTRVAVPVAPAAHYFCGGIVTDNNARTSIKNLYASGECASTGLHGANRLASNSLLEALVFSHRAFEDVRTRMNELETPKRITLRAGQARIHPREEWISERKTGLRKLMSCHVGIVRSNARLTEAQQHLCLLSSQLEELYSVSAPSVSICELRNMVGVARLVVEHSLQRKENKGTFYNKDLEL
jgi:L-aspartate oxidase